MIMKHLVLMEMTLAVTSSTSPMQFSIVLAAEIISRHTDKAQTYVTSHIVMIIAVMPSRGNIPQSGFRRG